MPVQSRIRGFFLCVSVLLLGLPGLGPVAWAQPLSLASDPAVMARVALGDVQDDGAALECLDHVQHLQRAWPATRP